MSTLPNRMINGPSGGARRAERRREIARLAEQSRRVREDARTMVTEYAKTRERVVRRGVLERAISVHSDFLGNLRAHRQAAGSELRYVLDQITSVRRTRLLSTLGDFGARRARETESLTSMLERDRESRRDQVESLLQGYRAERLMGTRELRRTLGKARRALAGAVGRLLKQAQAGHGARAEAWAEFTGQAMRKAPAVSRAQRASHPDRSGVSLSAERGRTSGHDEASTGASADAADAGPTSPELSLLSLIRSHPEGLGVTDLEKLLDLPRIRVAVLARRLAEQGHVIREGKLYIPVM